MSRPCPGRLNSLLRAALGSLGLLACIPAAAQSTEPDDGIVVTATRTERRNLDIPGAIDVVGAQTLQQGQIQVNLSETLGRVPGVIIQNRQNYAQDLQLSVRGFGFRSNFGIRGVKLYADGIPATMPDGQGQSATFDLSSAQRIEVMRGPFATLYGNAPGGVIQLFTKDGSLSPTLSSQVMAGSYGAQRLDVQFGGQSGAFNYIADWSQFHIDGWRDHSTAEREQFNAKIKWRTSDDTLVTLILNSLNQPNALDPLGLTQAQVVANPRQADPLTVLFNTRKATRQEQGGLTIEKRIDTGNTLRLAVYGGDREVRQYQSIPVPTTATVNTYSGGVVDLQRYFGGGSLNWIYDGSLLGQPLSATVGLEQEMMQDRRRGFDNNRGAMGTLRRDENNRVESTNVFAQVDWRFAERTGASLGVRSTRVSMALNDFYVTARNPDDTGKIIFSNTSPVAGLTYRLAPELSAYASAGRAFETPTFTELAYRIGGTGMNRSLNPGLSTNYEIGLKGSINADNRVTLARFKTNTRDEIVVDSATGGRTIYKNATRTERNGWEASWQALLPAGFDAYFAYTMVDAKYVDPFTSATSPAVAAGNRLPGVPLTSENAELRWNYLPLGFITALEARHASKVFVDDQNSDAAAAYTVVNLRFGLEQKARGWRITETLRIDNIANINYIGSIIVGDSNSRYFETSPRRTAAIMLSASLAF